MYGTPNPIHRFRNNQCYRRNGCCARVPGKTAVAAG